MVLRRSLARTIALVALVAIPLPSIAATFNDVSSTRYVEAYTALQQQGVVQGFNDGSGRPYSALTRAEGLKVIMELEGSNAGLLDKLQQNLPPLPLFSDVDQTAWYAPYVEAGFRTGIVVGYPDGTFRPEEPLRVEEAVALLMRAYHVEEQGDDVHFSNSIDNRAGEWFTGLVNAAVDKNLFSSQEVLRVGYVITRGQFFDVAHRMDVVARESLTAYNRPDAVAETPPTPQSSQVATPPVVSPIVPSQPTTYGPQTPLPQPPSGTEDLTQFASDKFFAVSIPALGIRDLSITHPADPFTSDGILAPLQSGVGHLFGYPGGNSTVLIYGHSSGYPWDVSQYTKIFRQINALKPGNRVFVTYNRHLYVYQVSRSESVPAGDLASIGSSGEELILYTCWPPDSISKRYLVHALPVQTIALQ